MGKLIRIGMQRHIMSAWASSFWITDPPSGTNFSKDPSSPCFGTIHNQTVVHWSSFVLSFPFCLVLFLLERNESCSSLPKSSSSKVLTLPPLLLVLALRRQMTRMKTVSWSFCLDMAVTQTLTPKTIGDLIREARRHFGILFLGRSGEYCSKVEKDRNLWRINC